MFNTFENIIENITANAQFPEYFQVHSIVFQRHQKELSSSKIRDKGYSMDKN